MNPPPAVARLSEFDPSARVWRARLLRLGHRRSVLLIAAVSVAFSVGLTSLLAASLDFPVDGWIEATSIAIIVPSIVAPLAAHFIVSLLFELERSQARLIQLAIRDPLTQTYNRRYVMDCLAREAERALRTNDPLSALMIDADEFKLINDRYGHEVGDEVLKALAPACHRILRPYDTLARIGGEEFSSGHRAAQALRSSRALSVADRRRACWPPSSGARARAYGTPHSCIGRVTLAGPRHGRPPRKSSGADLNSTMA